VTSDVDKFAVVLPSGLSFTGLKRAPSGSKTGTLPMPLHGGSPVVSSPLKPNIRVPARMGNATMLLFVAVFGGWGYFAHLDGGAIAPGVINPDSGKKTIQHLEGGIIAEMRVREGEAVTIGQPLVVLESTQARAAHESLVQQRWSLLARKARLDAESGEQNRIEWPPDLLSADRQIRSIVEAQQEVFDARRLTHATKKSVLAQRNDQ
jgi:HlyD family secretion protein